MSQALCQLKPCFFFFFFSCNLLHPIAPGLWEVNRFYFTNIYWEPDTSKGDTVSSCEGVMANNISVLGKWIWTWFHIRITVELRRWVRSRGLHSLSPHWYKHFSGARQYVDSARCNAQGQSKSGAIVLFNRLWTGDQNMSGSFYCSFCHVWAPVSNWFWNHRTNVRGKTKTISDRPGDLPVGFNNHDDTKKKINIVFLLCARHCAKHFKCLNSLLLCHLV